MRPECPSQTVSTSNGCSGVSTEYPCADSIERTSSRTAASSSTSKIVSKTCLTVGCSFFTALLSAISITRGNNLLKHVPVPFSLYTQIYPPICATTPSSISSPQPATCPAP